MMESNCENLWANNSVADFVYNPTEDYREGSDDTAKKIIISQKRLTFKILSLWIKN